MRILWSKIVIIGENWKIFSEGSQYFWNLTFCMYFYYQNEYCLIYSISHFWEFWPEKERKESKKERKRKVWKVWILLATLHSKLAMNFERNHLELWNFVKMCYMSKVKKYECLHMCALTILQKNMEGDANLHHLPWNRIKANLVLSKLNIDCWYH